MSNLFLKPMSNLEAIFAVDIQNGIAKNGKIPWKSKIDMTFFKEKTTHQIIIMGSQTLLSLPHSKPLQNRQNIVLTNNINKYSNLYKNYSSHEIRFMNLPMILDWLSTINTETNNNINTNTYNNTKKIYIIGGKQIYDLFLPYCSKIWITQFKSNYDCDLQLEYNISNYRKQKIYNNNDLEIYCFEKF